MTGMVKLIAVLLDELGSPVRSRYLPNNYPQGKIATLRVQITI